MTPAKKSAALEAWRAIGMQWSRFGVVRRHVELARRIADPKPLTDQELRVILAELLAAAIPAAREEVEAMHQILETYDGD